MPSPSHRTSQSPKPSPKPHQLLPQPTPSSPHPSSLHESTQADSTPFNPLFTLLTTHPTSTTHHPTMHYLFSDDDPSLLTSAAVSTLSPTSPTSPASPASPPDAPHPSHLTTPTPTTTKAETKEHILLIDLDATGTRVTNAQSMSPEWAITNAEIGAAPTWGEEREGDGEGGLMLRIEGVEARRGGGVMGGERKGREKEKEKEREKEKGAELDVEEFEGLVERFQRGMEGLRRVVEAGERWGVQGEEEGGEDGR